MTREEKIEILVGDRVWEWVYAYCLEDLRGWLRREFKGFDNFTDKELDHALGEVNVSEVKKILKREKVIERKITLGQDVSKL